MEKTYKGQKIFFNEATAKFFIEGGTKQFASLGRAQKFIDAAYPERPFTPFKIFSIEGRHMDYRDEVIPMKVYEYTVTGAEYHKPRKYDRNGWVSYILVQPNGHTHAKREDWITAYNTDDLEAVKAAQGEIDEITERIETLVAEKEAKNKAMTEKFEAKLSALSEAAGNKQPTQVL